MTPERWHQITDVFQAALGRDTARQSTFLDEACAGDPELRSEVEAMLGSHARAGAFGESPIAMSTLNLPRLESGASVGPYRIEGVIGAGGMGVVYRAHDPRVGRDVAIKMLPAEYATDAERLRRFEQEARAVGALNHPNLLTLHDVGTSRDQPYLVTELVDGETLRDHITRGALPPRRAFGVTAEIARGLAAAHAKDIVHRDLKPENIMIARDGRVKILDFGIAKLRPREAARTEPAVQTATANVLGTAGYMAPEQVRGANVDGRTDIFALGAILFELLTGRRAFDRATAVETLNAILHDDPPDVAAPVPAAADRIVRRCLAKDPARRFQSADDLAFALEMIDGGALPAHRDQPPATRRAIGTRNAAVAVILATILSVVATVMFMPRNAATVPPVTRLVLQPPPDAPFFEGLFAISPDGSLVVYPGNRGGTRRLFLRRLDQFGAVPLPGTERPGRVFFSPDGQWIGFVSDGKLKKLRVMAAAAPIVLCDVKDFLGATWTADNTIIFAGVEQGLQRVSVEGGVPEAITTPDTSRHEIDHHNPHLLPGGKALLYTSHQGAEVFRVVVRTLASGQQKTLVEDGFDARYASTGHLVYASGHAIFAAPFDVERLELTGAALRLVDDVATVTDSAIAHFQLSANGTLFYIPKPPLGGRTLAWVDRSGSETPLPLPARAYGQPRLSPDGQRLAVSVTEAGRQEIWLYHFANETFDRVTLEGANRAPLWTPDGLRLTYTSVQGGTQQLLSQPADRSAAPETLVSSRNNLFAGAWTPDGRTLIYVDSPPTDVSEIALVRLAKDRRPQRLIRADGYADAPALSPDGRWLAFVSFETGRPEVYVQPFPGPGPRRQLTVGGGHEPMWRDDGRELFYRAGPRTGSSAPADGFYFYAVPVDRVAGIATGKPVLLFQDRYVPAGLGMPAYDVTPDGQRFVVVKRTDDELAPRHLRVVLNWTDELTRRVPRS